MKNKLLALALVAVIVATTSPSTAAETRPFAPVQAGFATGAPDIELYAPDRVLVQLTPAAAGKAALNLPMDKGASAGATFGLTDVDAALAAAGARSIERPYHRPQRAAKAAELGVDRWYLVRTAPGDMPALAARLAALPDVAAASPDWRAFPAAVPGDPLYPDHWGHNNTGQLPSYDWGSYSHTGPAVGTVGFDANAEIAWDTTFGASGVVIAILDSGVDVDHPDLVGNLLSGYDFGDNDSNPNDDSASPGHGTACAGVAASVSNSIGALGIAADCSILPCKIADSGGSMYFSYIQDGLYWAADQGADVISMSLGAAISSDAATDAAIAYAHAADCVILAATGNENASTISYPAINSYVIGVGAASPCGERKRSSSSRLELNPGVNPDPNGYTCDGERWWGSNYGSATQDDRGAVDVLAPTILPTTDIGGNGGYDSGDYDMYFNGTSCATPYAAGVCGLIRSVNPGWTPDQVRQQLVDTAQDVVSVESGTGWDRYAGYGMVDAAAAVGGGGGPVAPVASFTGSPTSGSFPLDVVFTDQSSGSPTSWSWTFGDGGTSTQQNPTHTYQAAGTYTVSLTATNDVGSDTATRTGYITVTEPGVTTFVTAGGETSVTGTVSGSYVQTAVSDDARETITEVVYTGHPVKQYSYLEHRWAFDLPAGGAATFHLEASRTAGADGDDMAFSYSTDGVNWLPLVTVASATEQAYTVPLGSLSGAVTVRVADTDRSWGNVGLDAVAVDYMAFELGDVQPTAPTADFAGDPTTGEYPLTVQFADLSTGGPTSWAWDFGDGSTATAQNPSHTYTAAGVYTVALTATNAQGSDTATKTDYVTVTEPGAPGTTMHVAAMTVGRVKSGPNYLGTCTVTIEDDQGGAVGGATVAVSYDGPTTGTTSGLTASDGTVTLQSSGMKRPSGEWCFEVTGVTHTDLTYDAGANVVTRACESGTVYDGRLVPAAVELLPNQPNPFNPMTELRFTLPRTGHVRLVIYDARGRVAATLVDGELGAGVHRITWDASRAASGVYFSRLEAGGETHTGKMILLK